MFGNFCEIVVHLWERFKYTSHMYHSVYVLPAREHDRGVQFSQYNIHIHILCHRCAVFRVLVRANRVSIASNAMASTSVLCVRINSCVFVSGFGGARRTQHDVAQKSRRACVCARSEINTHVLESITSITYTCARGPNISNTQTRELTNTHTESPQTETLCTSRVCMFL